MEKSGRSPCATTWTSGSTSTYRSPHRRRPPDSPLWRQAPTRWGALTTRRLRTSGVRAMLKTRLAAAGLPTHLTPHSFRVMVVTALLSQNVPVEEVQHLVGHSHPSTTQLYDRRQAADQPEHRRAHPLLRRAPLPEPGFRLGWYWEMEASHYSKESAGDEQRKEKSKVSLSKTLLAGIAALMFATSALSEQAKLNYKLYEYEGEKFQVFEPKDRRIR